MIPIYIKKVWRDISRQKTRTICILFSISLCLSVIGALFQTKDVFNQAIRQNAEKTNAADLTIYTSPIENDISFLTKINGIKEVEAKQQIRARVKINHEFRNFELIAYPDSPFFNINQLQVEPDSIQVDHDELLLEKSTMVHDQLAAGDQVMMTVPGKRPKQLTIRGTVEDVSRIPTRFSGLGYGYISKEVLAESGQSTADNLIHLTFEAPISESQKNKLIQEVKKELQANQITVFRAELSQETFLLRETIVNTILLLFMLLGVLAFLLGFLLNIHLFYRMVSEQVYEMSIQKVLGATASYIWRQLSAAVILIGSIVFCLSVTLSTAASYLFTGYLLRELNMGEAALSFSPKVTAMILVLSFLVPILAAFFPIQKVLRAPIIHGLQTISRPYRKQKKKRSNRGYFHFRVLSVRNSLTKKTQLITNILMLSFGGAIIIACAALNQSLQLTLKEMNQFWDYDAEWSISTILPAEQLLSPINELNGVKAVEAWTARNAVMSHSSAKRNVLLQAVPSQTAFVRPNMQEGEWLNQQIQNGIVISSAALPNISLGDSVTLQVGRQEKQWKVIGILGEQLTGPAVYLNQSDYNQWLQTASSNRLLIKMDEGQALAKSLYKVENLLSAKNIEIQASDQVQDMKDRPKEMIRMIIYSLFITGILFSGVGALNLLTSMSINVRERIKEIGIIRSIGGGKRKIYLLFIGEGLFITSVSWLCAVGLSYPLQALLTSKIGEVLIKSPLPSGLSLEGCILWLVVSLLIGILGSYLPARKAVNKPISELL
ncbi:FtsX-like permease family protein [Bacillus sp. FJAT-29814]|uniref:ABC transporter permease n=1 Tax=Bacillus sp. FJAT-29814 TaxID=1729688 RepID=UPI000836EA5D|nr:FtsX-like permease family protein [Bacillus sp. FJAT-29814]